MSATKPVLLKILHGFAKWTVTSWGFRIACTISIGLLGAGFFLPEPIWADAIAAVTGISSFTMIFLLQRSQSKEFAAIHVKLNEVISALSGADNKLINVEAEPEKEIEKVHKEHERRK